MRAEVSSVRTILATIRELSFHLSEEEVSEIALVLTKAMKRMLKEANETND